MSNKNKILFFVAIVLLIFFFMANIVIGSVAIPFKEVFSTLFFGAEKGSINDVIILSSRLPQAVTALFSGMALAVSGLMLQTLFSNPLADPSILGVSSGASLGVALVLLASGGGLFAIGAMGYMAVVVGALIGAMAVLSLIIIFATRIKSNVMLLVVGIMIGYLTSSLVTLMNFRANSDGIVSYLVWGMGDFSSVTNERLSVYIIFICVSLFLSLLLIKPMNALLLGERYAQNLGVKIKRTRFLLLLVTGILTAVVTAFCGPISFIGLAVPHIVRLMFKTSNHQIIVPATIIMGGVIALICCLLSNTLVAGQIVPINVVTPIIGAPVIIYVITNKKKIAYFN